MASGPFGTPYPATHSAHADDRAQPGNQTLAAGKTRDFQREAVRGPAVAEIDHHGRTAMYEDELQHAQEDLRVDMGDPLYLHQVRRFRFEMVRALSGARLDGKGRHQEGLSNEELRSTFARTYPGAAVVELVAQMAATRAHGVPAGDKSPPDNSKNQHGAHSALIRDMAGTRKRYAPHRQSDFQRTTELVIGPRVIVETR